MNDVTETLYDLDAYRDSFLARVLSCQPDEASGRFRIILDQTCFFPEQGGQSGDTGLLNSEIRVLDTQINHGVITHLTDKPILPGTEAEGKVCFERRYDFMQQHTGEHIFSGIVASMFGLHNVGFHLSDRTVTMDYDGHLSQEQVRAVEWQANEVIWKNLPVQISWPKEEEIPLIAYRSKKEIDGRLRLVTIPGVDVCACCAPHLRYTGEVGQLRVAAAARYKGGMRLHIVCGGRALLSARQHADSLSQACHALSCQEDSLGQQISSLLEKQKALTRAMENMYADELARRVDEIRQGEGHVILSAGPVSEKTASQAADRLACKTNGVCGVISDGRVVLVSQTISLRSVAQALRAETGFKGGGDDSCVRGMTSLSAEELSAWLDKHVRCS